MATGGVWGRVRRVVSCRGWKKFWRSCLAVIAICVVAVPVVASGGVVSAASGPAVQPVPGTRMLFGVACQDTSTCEAVGYQAVTSCCTAAAAVTITHGTPGRAHYLPTMPTLFGVSCPKARTCEAVGFNHTGEVVRITHGTLGRIRNVAAAAGATVLPPSPAPARPLPVRQ